jgi:hypothetical protein
MVANCELAALKPEARCRAKILAMARNDIIKEIGAGQRAKRKAQPPKLQDYIHAGLFFFLSSAVGVGAVMIAQYLGASGQSMW